MAPKTHTPTGSGAASPSRYARTESSTAVAMGSGSGAAAGGAGRSSKRALRDYYGIQAGDNTAAGTGDGSTSASVLNEPGAILLRYPDSPAFNARSAYESLISTLSLAQLLRKSAELVTEIRELDGEKQSLVYNHHHELVAASETIRKMKDRADGLDPSLDSLQASFSTMSQLAETLALPAHLLKPVSNTDDQKVS
ncbi:hypothetical protein OC846_002174 [Tilletia horrida]|uniref:Vacuolar protein sorting-associated protein 51 homolog n=1 Tax=Tilletia horrida TaxID=155126 RepID=A0AAN6GSK9_9BASI|nr:hypothetical protein OC846_002174 [Tilletia horrida]